ncbi:YqaA family protein [Kordiimonas laminariae]|uniref:YqaA family protein n=1 Tax=Kordiimonas laminariae TaxID=2917717 RepID=UPI001FF195E6|nr:DedA family protein [Kordiimonas laminariae]
MLRKLYDWTIEKAQSPASERWLGGLAFAESSFFPIPIDIMLIPMILANRLKAWRLATITLIMSVLGGIAGYMIGAFLFEVIGQPIIDFYGYGEKFAEFQEYYKEYGILIVLVAGFTPLPFKVVTIASGAVGLNPAVFTLVSIPARGARFYLVAALLYMFGEPIKDFIEKRLGLVTSAMMILGILGFVAIKYI